MVARSFFAFDNDALTVTSSSSGGLVGNGIINNSNTPNGTVFEYSAGLGTTVTIDDEAGGSETFNDGLPGGHTVLDGGGIVSNDTGVESESLIFIQALDEFGNTVGPQITIYVFSQNGDFSDVWGFASSAPLQDGVSYEKVGGINAGASNYDDYITCFGPGTKILTDKGKRVVEDLEVGDLVWTQHHQMQPIRWIGRTTVEAKGAFAPIVFAPGALENDKELVVSPEHRMCLRVPSVELLFGTQEVLVAAKHLTDLPGVSVRESDMITYTHFMFDQHEIIHANGQLSESFFFSELSLRGLNPAQAAELWTLFPDLSHDATGFGPTAAMVLKAKEASVLAYLYQKHAA
ncbi:MAG: Hint domain-containing protein [Pseudomonadota bacterium]